jgi:hypothetical protein
MSCFLSVDFRRWSFDMATAEARPTPTAEDAIYGQFRLVGVIAVPCFRTAALQSLHTPLLYSNVSSGLFHS